MKIEDRKPADIKPYPGNPRLNDSAVDAVAASIREFGFRQPIVVDADGVITLVVAISRVDATYRAFATLDLAQADRVYVQLPVKRLLHRAPDHFFYLSTDLRIQLSEMSLAVIILSKHSSILLSK